MRGGREEKKEKGRKEIDDGWIDWKDRKENRDIGAEICALVKR